MTITKGQYATALDKLSLTHATAAPIFGVTPRQSQKWAAGVAPIPTLVERVLGLLLAGKIGLEDLKC